MNDKANDCIRYCLIKARTGNEKDALDKISKALTNCKPDKKSIHECIILLKVLENEGRPIHPKQTKQ